MIKFRLQSFFITAILFIFVQACQSVTSQDKTQQAEKLLKNNNINNQQCVILLHGLARGKRSLAKMTNALENAGYATVNYAYPSRQYVIETLSENAITAALAQCNKHTRIHFVTHSLGGILVRQYLAKHDLANLGRVVMLGPPNKGSQVVDKLKRVPGFKAINGPAGLQLGTDENSVPNTLGAANFEVGVIAGTRSINPILSTLLPGQDDGKVSLSHTKLDGMADHIALPVTHPLMMDNPRVIKETLHFLQYGSFQSNKNLKSKHATTW